MNQNMRLRVGVIGTGGAAKYLADRLAREFSNSCEIIGIAGSDQSRAADLAAIAGGAAVYSSGLDLIGKKSVQAIVVATAGDNHEQYVMKAIASGKPVFCEKPLETTADACMRIVEAEVKFGRRLLQVGFVRRYDPLHNSLKEVIASGEIGTPLFLHGAHRNPGVHDRFTNEMVLNDMCVHDIDSARWLLNGEIETVLALQSKRNSWARSDLDDPLFVIMTTREGTIVDIELSANMGFGYDIRSEVSGERGLATLAETNPVIIKAGGRFAGNIPPGWRERFDQAFYLELRDWLLAAQNQTAHGASAWDGYLATKIAEACKASLASGQRISMEYPECPRMYRAH